jgi:hypothetical protein
MSNAGQFVEPEIIALDSSHWAKWIDATNARDPDRRLEAVGFYDRLIERGRIPVLSWHHLEELLGVDDEGKVQSRVAFLQKLPLLASFSLPKDEVWPGSIMQILAAEAIAVSEGCGDLRAVRDSARKLLLKIGTGAEAIGAMGGMLEPMKPVLRSRRAEADLVAALSPLRSFDDNRTIAELSKASIVSPAQMAVQLDRVHAAASAEAMQSTGGDVATATAMADAFTALVLERLPPPDMSVRDLLVSTLVAQGLDETEIRDVSVLSDLIRLAAFRSQLRLVASATGRSFEEFKRVPMELLPSRVIGEALKEHGQPRARRPGSDLNDRHLGGLAAYCSVLYVDKRTAEDFRRARQKVPQLRDLIGEVAKAADFTGLLGSV